MNMDSLQPSKGRARIETAWLGFHPVLFLRLTPQAQGRMAAELLKLNHL